MGTNHYGDLIVRGLRYERLTSAQVVTIAASLGAADEGLHLYDSDKGVMLRWDGSEFARALSVEISTPAAGAFTAVAADVNNFIVVDLNVAGLAVTIPDSSGLSIGDRFTVFNKGAFTGTLTPSGGNTLIGPRSVPPSGSMRLTVISATEWAVEAQSGGAIYLGEVDDQAQRLSLPASVGQTVWQADGGSSSNGGMYQLIREPATSDANWVLIGERTAVITLDSTVILFDSTSVDWSQT